MTKKLAESYKKAYGFWEVTTEGDCEGEEVALTDPCDAFTGCWELEDETTGTTYRVHVMT